MPPYNATYTSNGTAQPARLSLQKHKAVIHLYTPDGERTVHWFYHQISRDAENKAIFSYTGYPAQTLEILEASLADELGNRLKQGKKLQKATRNRIALSLLGGALLVIGLLYFAVLPWAATALAARVPVAYEKELGDRVFEGMKNEYTIDAARSAHATAFFEALRITSPYNIRVTVAQGDVSNAFAIPGGHIVIYSGLLNQLTDDPQLAALLAHEFIHIQNRHSLKSLFRQMSASLLFGTLFGDAGAAGHAVLRNADDLKNLSYSRSLETEADADGLALLEKRNIDARGFTGLFKILQKEPGTQTPEWTSSHPNLENRIRNIEQSPWYKTKPAANPTLHTLFLKIKTAD